MGYRRYTRYGEVTPREVLVSIIIALVIIAIGFSIINGVTNEMEKRNEVYYKALKIDNDAEIFNYAQRTDAGNALVYADINAVDTVSMPEIKGEFLYLEKTKEKYTMHTRTVTTTVNGKTTTRTETYWTWDYAGRDVVKSKELEIYGNVYNTSSIKFNNTIRRLTLNDSIFNKVNGLDRVRGNYIYDGTHVRYYYDYVPSNFKANFLTHFSNNTINTLESNYIELHSGTIEDRLAGLEKSVGVVKVVFWIIISIIVVVVIYLFVREYHHWLERG